MDEPTELRVPKTPFQRLVRELAEKAMSVTHHDASDTEIGYIHEVDRMERMFGPTIRGYMAAQTRRRRRAPGIDAAEADETRSGSAGGESPIGKAEAPLPPPPSPRTQGWDSVGGWPNRPPPSLTSLSRNPSPTTM